MKISLDCYSSDLPRRVNIHTDINKYSKISWYSGYRAKRHIKIFNPWKFVYRILPKFKYKPFEFLKRYLRDFIKKNSFLSIRDVEVLSQVSYWIEGIYTVNSQGILIPIKKEKSLSGKFRIDKCYLDLSKLSDICQAYIKYTIKFYVNKQFYENLLSGLSTAVIYKIFFSRSTASCMFLSKLEYCIQKYNNSSYYCTRPIYTVWELFRRKVEYVDFSKKERIAFHYEMLRQRSSYYSLLKLNSK